MKIGTVEFEVDSTKIQETDKTLVIPATIAREAILQYEQGMAYRPKEELRESFLTFDNAFVVSGKHPDQMIVSKPKEITGKIANPVWHEEDGKITGEVILYKNRNTPEFLADIKSGKLKDLSIGFVYTEDWTGGTWNGAKYDFIQRDIVINHVAVGVPHGRCPSPLCGLSVDMATISIGLDPWEENANTIRSGHGDASKAEECRTKVVNEGLSLVVCKNKDTGIWFDQSWLFKKDQGWTMQKAKEWFAKHTGDSRVLISQLAAETTIDSPNVGVDFGEADFPDSCFAWVPESAKGPDGNKSERKLPYKNKDGTIDLPHVRNALARLSQTQGIPDAEKARIKTMLEDILKRASPDYTPSGDSVLTMDAETLIERSQSLRDMARSIGLSWLR